MWEGGLQFSGGFLGAIIFGIPSFRRWDRRTRWRLLDGFAYGLAIGLAIGRIGCYAVGEHFGRRPILPRHPLRRRLGGPRAHPLGDLPLTASALFHQTALYEFIYLLLLFGSSASLSGAAAGATAIGIFCPVYGVCRFLSDFLRVNDERCWRITGAQYLRLGLVLASVWIWFVVRPVASWRSPRRCRQTRRVDGGAGGTPEPDGLDDDPDGDPVTDPPADEDAEADAEA